MQKKEDKIEMDSGLIQYASEVVKNNYTCRDVRKWLEEHQHDIQSFFAALTLIKKGNLENESYQEVAQEFLAKFKTEIMQNWSPRFQSTPQSSPLYQAALASFETNEEQQTVASPF